jgi:hypothetical protein
MSSSVPARQKPMPAIAATRKKMTIETAEASA